ncbi:hypothetical protein [Methylicorpusculum sp.]|uniref:hypothetical protein n=1 Tax=Methylicorpusculum sp. TaxID=2713644 RepID=UPI002AB9DF36|nr:hypothetical protein [Methylicorpusculum sp.]MDZ4151633.1 hypothetical protein [Methylicorpusculum sp.]
MTFTRAIFAYEKRAVVIGLLAFLLLAVALPIAATTITSFGPSEWVAEYVAPSKQFQLVLFVFVGAIAAWCSTSAAIVNSTVVGLIGGVCLLLLAATLGASPQLSVAAHLFQYVFVTVVFCSLGGLCASLLRRYRKAL